MPPNLPSEQKTPIHIRGKRNSKTTAADIRKSKKRRLSPASWDRLHATQTEGIASIKLSPLELLPVELLEQIFFESLREPPSKVKDRPSRENGDINVYTFSSRIIDRYDWSLLLSLPLASPVLGHKLCSVSTLSRLIKLVFFPLSYNLPSDLADLGFRSAILRMKWMTPALWKEARPHPFLKPEYCPSHYHSCWIPSKLLRGPWEDEKIEFLRDLRGFGARINLDESYDGEIADEALCDAILSRNIKVVRLLSFDDMSLRPLLDGGWMDDNPAFENPEDQQQEFQLVHLSFQVRSKHVKLAVMEGGCDPAMVVTLILGMRMNPKVQHSDHVEYEALMADLRQWVSAPQQEGNEGAAWLGEYLVRISGKCLEWG